MIVGVAAFVAGLILFQQGKQEQSNHLGTQKLQAVIEAALADGVLTDNEKKLIADTARNTGNDPDKALRHTEEQLSTSFRKRETQIINQNQQNGLDFEKFVVGKFDRRYITLVEWTGDKYANGVYAASNEHPDLLLELKYKDVSARFAIECKFRSHWYKGGLDIATDEQMQRYRRFEQQQGIPVFLVIGFGGVGAQPERIFIRPLRHQQSGFIPQDLLEKWEHLPASKNFFYDAEKRMLR